MTEVLAYDVTRRNNARLMVDCRQLGYLSNDEVILDVTYGLGAFWNEWRPARLTGHDLIATNAPDGPMDFTALDYSDRTADVVVFDPPYKLNGTSAHPSDDRYGVGGEYSSVKDRLDLIRRGLAECARVARRRVLVKCQDQVNAGRIVWQTHMVVVEMAGHGWRLEDRLEVHGYRPQPAGRSQQHARRTSSSLLVFERAS